MLMHAQGCLKARTTIMGVVLQSTAYFPNPSKSHSAPSVTKESIANYYTDVAAGSLLV